MHQVSLARCRELILLLIEFGFLEVYDDSGQWVIRASDLWP